MKTGSEEKLLRLAVNLKGKNAKEFQEIQEYLSIESSTDVMRYLIGYFHREKLARGLDKPFEKEP